MVDTAVAEVNVVLEKWAEVKALVENVEPDLVKNARGVSAAGVRTRKGLRILKARIQELVKLTNELDKAKKAAK
jgi:hypothetical protein